jgi:uncharacterized tellurite resistance protein B-like protein
LNRVEALASLRGMATSGPASASDAPFAFELLKLLLQVAWADDDVSPAEANALLTYAKKNQLSQDKLDLLATCLTGKAPLPAPNLGFLKERRLDVLRAVKELLLSDLHVADEEEAILGQISSLLC